MPEGIPRLQERLKFLNEPVKALQTFLQKVDGFMQPGAMNGSSGSTMAAALFAGTTHFAASFFETILVLYFLLVSGTTFLRRAVEILPNFNQKRQAVEMSQDVEKNISAYLATITVMNAAVGLGTGLIMWLTGLSDLVLWGVTAFLLNFVPILGPLLVPGAILAVPMLAITKIVCDGICPLAAIGHFLSGDE